MRILLQPLQQSQKLTILNVLNQDAFFHWSGGECSSDITLVYKSRTHTCFLPRCLYTSEDNECISETHWVAVILHFNYDVWFCGLDSWLMWSADTSVLTVVSYSDTRCFHICYSYMQNYYIPYQRSYSSTKPHWVFKLHSGFLVLMSVSKS